MGGLSVKTPIRQVFEQFVSQRYKLELSLESLTAKFKQYHDGIVLYGAGSSGIALLQTLRNAGIEPICFCDAAPQKWGKTCRGLSIIAPEQLVQQVGKNILVIVCINTDGRLYCRSFEEALRKGGHPAVHRRLHDAGCDNVIDYAELRTCYTLFQGDKEGNLPCCPDVPMMLEHQEEIEKIYEDLLDDCSKKTFLNILSYRLLGQGGEIPTFPQEEQYFPSGLIHLTKDERFIDCGAYHGTILSGLLQRTEGHIGSYYGIEPDIQNYKKLQQCVNEMSHPLQSRIHLVYGAACQTMQEQQLYELEGPGSYLANYGRKMVPGISIDTLLDGRLTTSIKMNIEGSELSALHGAEQTIKRWHPKLMIAGYHKTWDFWEIPNFIKQSGEGAYQLGLRSYMHQLSFVFYAI